MSVDLESNQALPQAEQIERAIAMLRGTTIALLTGAGISTDSGIPDYRGKGSSKRTPMTWSQFRTDPEYRKRYWAGSQLGWKTFGAAEPNAGHRALARLESAKLVSGIVTQNVDGLHVRAGSRHVVDLHGSMDRVRCMSCGQYFARQAVAEQIVAENPSMRDYQGVIGPDGDAIPGDLTDFLVPDCTVCGGLLRPDIVFFGEFVPTDRFGLAQAMVASAGALVVAGSSLTVNSGVRLVEVARRRKLPVLIINVGETRGDRWASLKIDAGTTPTLTRIADALLEG
jgi:NAD-dependent SIR2 family protein deacetylase